jgi:N,N-dimethylformamidase
MANFLAWTFVVAAAIVAIAAAQFLKLYILRRWSTQVRLTDPVGYTDAPSFGCDKEIALRIHSSKPVKVRFNRCSAIDFECVHEMDAPASLQSGTMHRWRGFDWKASLTLTPNTLAPGFYRIDIEHEGDSSQVWRMPLIVKDVISHPVIVVASTNTWNAYNEFGGLSNYQDRATPQPLRIIRVLMKYLDLRIRIGERHWTSAVPLPERRPNARVHCDLTDKAGDTSHLVRGEAVLIRFLEREGIEYSVMADRDFAYDMTASKTRLIIFNTHTEYWSEEMIGRLDEFIQRDVGIVFLSGNNMYRKVQFTREGIFVIGIVAPEQVVPMIGTYYDASGYCTFDAYRVTDAGHWCFRGLGVQEGSEFGQGTAIRSAASGFETDKVRSGGNGFRVVAIGKNSEGPAFMACRDLSGGGFVFTVGSVSFAQCLEDDLVIQGLVLNLIHRSLGDSVLAEISRAEQGES